MPFEPESTPRLRPIEAHPFRHGGQRGILIRDGSHISDVQLTVSEPVLLILSMLDGRTKLETVRQRFGEQLGSQLPADTLAGLIDQLDAAHLLEGPSFEAHYESLLNQYRSSGVRRMRTAAESDGAGEIRRSFAQILAEADGDGVAGETRASLVGLIAPHLDYPRGRPCYGTAYKTLVRREAPKRVVVLGTNHFGRSAGPVATVASFTTPLGTTKGDVAFVEQLEVRCGALRTFEYDHVNEHSVELQVLWLQHLYGAEAFKVVPVLCPDPCGPTGTRPMNGQGADLKQLALALRELIAADGADTLVIAGADLSHVGAAFGDERRLDEDFLNHVRRLDGALLEYVAAVEPERMRQRVSGRQNCTRVCSIGCIYALLTALPDTRARILGYHQAVDEPTQTCVTCTAAAFQR
ncbi:MAG TPA: AmmeMemoRadiSam system protein B [Phycisphaerae bacterium]|jgi:hypothetical protein